MKPQEIEIWARDIIDSVLDGQPVEDSRVELKAKWPEAEKAAPRLGGHANASRGENILWLIGVDERNSSLTNVAATEKGDWYKAVEKYFDGFAPRLLVDVNFKISGNTIVALYFDTATEAPFVIRSKNGGSYPEYIVPWREGTMLRAARRENLLRLLIPVYKLSALISELEFNEFIGKKVVKGCFFKEEAFRNALQNGVIEDLPKEDKEKLMDCYLQIEMTNKVTDKWFQERGIVFLVTNETTFAERAVEDSVSLCLKKIKTVLSVLRKFQQILKNELPGNVRDSRFAREES